MQPACSPSGDNERGARNLVSAHDSLTRQRQWGRALAEVGRLRSAHHVLTMAREAAVALGPGRAVALGPGRAVALGPGRADLVSVCEEALSETQRLAALSPTDQFDRLSRLSLGRLMTMIESPFPARILDAGCGAGTGTALLARRFADATVVGVDKVGRVGPDPVLAPGHGAVYMVTADLLSDPTDLATDLGGCPGAFDVVYCHAVLHLVEDARGLLAALHTQLAPGGQLVATCFTSGYFRSVRKLCDSLGLKLAPPPPHEAIGLAEDLAEVGFEQVRMQTDDVVLEVPTGMESIYLSRIIGRRPSRRELHRVLAASSGLDLDLHPLTISAYSRR